MLTDNDNLQITVSCSGDRWVLGLAGCLDLATGGQLEELGDLLGADGPNQVCVDLQGLEFIDTAGLHALTRSCEVIREGGGEPTVAGTASSPAVARLLGALGGRIPGAEHLDLGPRPVLAG